MKALSHALIGTSLALAAVSTSTRADASDQTALYGDCRDNLEETMSRYLHRVEKLPGNKTKKLPDNKTKTVCFVRYFVADKDAPVYAEETAPEAEVPIGRIPIGSAYFAIQEGSERIQIATHGATDSEVVGWARKKDLLENLYKAVPLGEAPEREIMVRTGLLAGGLAPNNELHLRVVSQPERGTIVARVPGVDQGDPIFSWRWYYIFDTEQSGEDGRVWGLLGSVPVVGGKNRSLVDTDSVGFEHVLKGWAPLDEMTVWATQLAIEVNTAIDAVQQRREDQGPAVVHSIERPDALPIWEEPINNWYVSGALVRKDPHGLDRSLLRQAVVQPLGEGAYVEVASAASRTGRLSGSEIDELRRKVEDTIDSLMRMDIVFVIDATKSMVADIETTRRLVRQIRETMATAAGSRETVTIQTPGIGDINVSLALDISVSVIGFKDTADAAQLLQIRARKGEIEGDEGHYYTVRTYGQRLDLIKDDAEIDRAFDLAVRDTRYISGKEALYEGLREVFDRDVHGRERYWREGVVSRAVVVLTDEPGDSGPDQLRALIAEMPGFSEHERRIMGSSEVGASSLGEKRAKTQIFAVFLGKQYCWKNAPDVDCKAKFRANMKDFTHALRIFDSDRRREERIIRAIHSMIAEYTMGTDERLRTLANMFKEEVKAEGGARRIFRAASGLTGLAIGIALERAGLTLEELGKLNEVVYYSGYVKVDEIASPLGQQSGAVRDGTLPKWRMRVMLSRSDVVELADVTGKVCRALKNLLPQEDNGLIPDWMKAEPKHPKENIARLILLAVDQVSGQKTYEGKDGRAEFEWRVDQFLDTKNAQKRIGETARITKVLKWLPLRPGGFLSSDLRELLDRDIGWFLGEKELLCNKREGLERILGDLTIPEAPGNMSNADTKGKLWFHRLGIDNIIEVAYVPIGYIP